MSWLPMSKRGVTGVECTAAIHGARLVKLHATAFKRAGVLKEEVGPWLVWLSE